MMWRLTILPHWGRWAAAGGWEGASLPQNAPTVSAARCRLPQRGRL